MKYPAVKSTGSVEVYTWNPANEYVTRFMVIDPQGNSDEVLHKSWADAAQDLLQDRGIGDALEAAMRSDGVRPLQGCCPTREHEEDVWNWFVDRRELVEELLVTFGYRILPVERLKERK